MTVQVAHDEVSARRIPRKAMAAAEFEDLAHDACRGNPRAQAYARACDGESSFRSRATADTSTALLTRRYAKLVTLL
jgi:hypothetical protein